MGENNIGVLQLFKIFRKNIWAIIAITFLSTATCGIVNYFFIKPIYQSSTEILINQTKTGQQPFNSSDIQTNLELINTYRTIIQSPAILGIVRVETGLARTEEELKKQINVSNEQNSQVVTITVQDENPKTAALIANKIASVFKGQIPTIMNIDNVTILSEAKEPGIQDPVKPQKLLNITIAFLASLMISLILVFLYEYFDRTIRNEYEVQTLLGLPLLGAIPNTTLRDMKLKDKQIEEQRVSNLVRSENG